MIEADSTLKTGLLNHYAEEWTLQRNAAVSPPIDFVPIKDRSPPDPTTQDNRHCRTSVHLSRTYFRAMYHSITMIPPTQVPHNLPMFLSQIDCVLHPFSSP